MSEVKDTVQSILESPDLDASVLLLKKVLNGGDVGQIDEIQQDVESVLSNSFSIISDETIYAISLSIREALLNAINHGCKSNPKIDCGFELLYTANDKSCFTIVWDEGSGYDYKESDDDDANPVDAGGHCGLILIKNFPDQVKVSCKGRVLRMTFHEPNSVLKPELEVKNSANINMDNKYDAEVLLLGGVEALILGVKDNKLLTESVLSTVSAGGLEGLPSDIDKLKQALSDDGRNPMNLHCEATSLAQLCCLKNGKLKEAKLIEELSKALGIDSKSLAYAPLQLEGSKSALYVAWDKSAVEDFKKTCASLNSDGKVLGLYSREVNTLCTASVLNASNKKAEVFGSLSIGLDKSEFYLSNIGKSSESLSYGLNDIFKKLQEALSLKFIGSARRLVFDDSFDFEEHMDLILSPFVDQIEKVLKEAGVDKSNISLLVDGFPGNKDVFEKYICEKAGVYNLASDQNACDSVLSSKNLVILTDSVSANSVSPNLLESSSTAVAVPPVVAKVTAKETSKKDVAKKAPKKELAKKPVKKEKPAPVKKDALPKKTKPLKASIAASKEAPNPEEKKKKIVKIAAIAAIILLLFIGFFVFSSISEKNAKEEQARKIAQQRLEFEKNKKEKELEKASARLKELEALALEKEANEKLLAEEKARLEAQMNSKLSSLQSQLDADRDALKEAKEKAGSLAGVIVFKTEVDGAEIFLNGEKLGETPAILEGIKQGEYEFTLKKEGYHDATGTVRVEAGRIASIDSVEMNMMTTMVHISSEPQGLRYTFERLGSGSDSIEGVTPQSTEVTEPGPYRVTVHNDGWQPVVKQVDVDMGDEYRIDAEFIGGNMSFNTNPVGAKILLNGKKVGVTPLKMENIPTGEYEILYVKKGCYFANEKILLEQGSDVDRSIRLYNRTETVPVRELEKIPVAQKTNIIEVPSTLTTSSGIVSIICTISETGTLENMVIKKGMNDKLDRFVLDMVKDWTFTPAKRMGYNVKTRVVLPVKVNAKFESEDPLVQQPAG